MENIDLYYESIKQVYEQIVDWKKPPTPLLKRAVGKLQGISIFFLIISIIPILPLILTYTGSNRGWNIYWLGEITQTLGSLSWMWVGCFVLSLILVLFTTFIDNKIKVPEAMPPQSLSPEQLTFVVVYEAYKELKIFFVSHVDQHVLKTVEALERLSPVYSSFWYRNQPDNLALTEAGDGASTDLRVHPYLYRDFRGFDLEGVAARANSFAMQISSAQDFLKTFEKYAWFQIDVETKATLQALMSVEEKILPRLKAREDLPAVLSILKSFSQFTYAYLPEHKAHLDSEALSQLQSEGATSLRLFVKEVNQLTQYPKPTKKSRSRKDTSPNLNEKVYGYYIQSVFFRFTLWFMLVLALTAGAVYLLTYFVSLSPDTMATVVIGTSVASAAALAGFLPQSSKSD